jgi:[FeFe] hydrogenase (group B1/B3)
VVAVTGITDAAVNGSSLGLGGYLDIGLVDTMQDLLVNFIGAVVFSMIGVFLLQGTRARTSLRRWTSCPAAKKRTGIFSQDEGRGRDGRGDRENNDKETLDMRGMETGKTRIRHQVFTEIARMAYEGGDLANDAGGAAYKIVPGEIATYSDSIFMERAVVGERLRLALGMPLRKFSEYSKLSEGIVENEIAEKYYEPPLINVVKFACNKCPDNVVTVTSGCQGCIEHPCMEVCPKKAISRVKGRAFIDTDKCIKCGRCAAECKFHAIIHQKRPCKQACGVGAIGKDEYGRAEIDYDKCTSCGQCLVNCPFGAISDKSQIFQTISAIKSGTPVYAALAPSFVGQFGPDATPEKMKAAFRRLGFADVYEVAVGADLCVIEEANDYLDEVPEKHSFMVTSCCPSWSDMVRKMFPEFTDNISVALTPMVLTARMIKNDHPDCRVVFVGPCDSKKLEARRRASAATWISC